MKVLAIDPGKTTGFALYDHGEHVAWMMKYDPGTKDLEAMHWLGRFLQQEGHTLSEVVSESIVITKKTQQKSQDVLVSIEQIGIARWACACSHVPFSTQQPGEGLAFGSDNKLRTLGWWTPGPDHARAASRHLITRLCKVDSEFARDLAVRLG